MGRGSPYWGKAFQGNFEFVFTDKQSGRELWRFRENEYYHPTRLFVSDRGMTVIHGDFLDMKLVEPGGRQHDINLVLPEADRQYVHETTAGPMWAGFSRWYFAELGADEYFVIRTWWSRRLVVSLQTAKQVELDAALNQRLDTMDKAWVMRTLEEPQADTYEKMTAAHMAGQMHIKDALPALRELEMSEYVDRLGGGARFGCRAMAQLSLRRLGRSPAGLPAWAIGPDSKEVDWKNRVWHVPFTHDGRPREHWAGVVGAGMSLGEVLKLIGPPDATRWGRDRGECWEWDMDTDKPYTLRVWHKDSVILSVEQIRPAVWEGSLLRDEELAN